VAQQLLRDWRMANVSRWLQKGSNLACNRKSLLQLIRLLTNRYYAQGFNDGAEFRKYNRSL